jgi:hypothetical protein
MAGLRIAMEQDHRIARAGREVVELDAVDRGEAGFDARGVGHGG